MCYRQVAWVVAQFEILGDIEEVAETKLNRE